MTKQEFYDILKLKEDFLLDGSNVVAETKNNTTTNYIRGVSGIISSSIQGTNNTTKYYLSDGHGNVTNLTDSSGAVVKTYSYDAFGVEENINSTDTNPFRYCGEYYDIEIGQIYLRARYYDPSLGRFTQQDPAMANGMNWYVYCGNDPANRSDETGLEFDIDFEELQWIADRYGWIVAGLTSGIAHYAREKSNAYAREMGLDKTYDNKADAWRHFLLSAKMTNDLDVGKAKVIADYHEYKAASDLGWVKGGSFESGRVVTKMNQAMLMDLWNNQVGRKMAMLSEGMTVSYEHMWQYAMSKNYIIQNAEEVFSFLGIEEYINTSDWTVTVTWELETGNVTVHKPGKDDITLKIGV